MMEFCRYFTYIHLLGAEPHDRMIWSVFIISHQFMNSAGNIELSFTFPAECSGAGPSTHHASRDRKKFGDISLSQIQLSFFPEGLRYAHWEWKMWVRGHNDFSFHLKQTNSIYLAHTYIHMLKNHHTAEKNIFCFKDYLHF